MYYSPAMDEIKDFTDLAAAFTGDIRQGFISQAEGNGMEKAGICFRFNSESSISHDTGGNHEQGIGRRKSH